MMSKNEHGIISTVELFDYTTNAELYASSHYPLARKAAGALA